MWLVDATGGGGDGVCGFSWTALGAMLVEQKNVQYPCSLDDSDQGRRSQIRIADCQGKEEMVVTMVGGSDPVPRMLPASPEKVPGGGKWRTYDGKLLVDKRLIQYDDED